MINPFKKGDQVRCIQELLPRIQKGDVFTITKDDPRWVYVVDSKNGFGGWYPNHFELVPGRGGKSYTYSMEDGSYAPI
jgi:hypothetical protein